MWKDSYRSHHDHVVLLQVFAPSPPPLFLVPEWDVSTIEMEIRSKNPMTFLRILLLFR